LFRIRNNDITPTIAQKQVFLHFPSISYYCTHKCISEASKRCIATPSLDPICPPSPSPHTVTPRATIATHLWPKMTKNCWKHTFWILRSWAPILYLNVPHGPTKGFQPLHEMTHAAFHPHDLIQIPHGLPHSPTYDQKWLKLAETQIFNFCVHNPLFYTQMRPMGQQKVSSHPMT
jgi:hypothetical protein